MTCIYAIADKHAAGNFRCGENKWTCHCLYCEESRAVGYVPPFPEVRYNPETEERICNQCGERDTEGDVPLCVDCQEFLADPPHIPGEFEEKQNGEDYYAWRHRRIRERNAAHTDD
jgi:hypothetical protein